MSSEFVICCNNIQVQWQEPAVSSPLNVFLLWLYSVKFESYQKLLS